MQIRVGEERTSNDLTWSNDCADVVVSGAECALTWIGDDLVFVEGRGAKRKHPSVFLGVPKKQGKTGRQLMEKSTDTDNVRPFWTPKGFNSATQKLFQLALALNREK